MNMSRLILDPNDPAPCFGGDALPRASNRAFLDATIYCSKCDKRLPASELVWDGTNNAAGSYVPERTRTRFVSKTRAGLHVIPVDEVLFFRAEDKYTTLYHEDGETLILDPIRKLDQEFGNRFIRIHRNALIAAEYFTGTHMYKGRHYATLTGTDIRPMISRRRMPVVRKFLLGYS